MMLGCKTTNKQRRAHSGLLSKSIAEDPDDCAATSREYNVLHYESPIARLITGDWQGAKVVDQSVIDWQCLGDYVGRKEGFSATPATNGIDKILIQKNEHNYHPKRKVFEIIVWGIGRSHQYSTASPLRALCSYDSFKRLSKCWPQ